MTNMIKHDFYRISKGTLFYSMMFFVSAISLFFTMIVRHVNLGIYVSGYVMEFRNVYDVIQTGILYQRGLGILVAILIAVFIGQEYQWKTWQHKWLAKKNRIQIYLSKLIVSSTLSILIFLIFQIIALIFSTQPMNILTLNYATTIIGGIAIYATLGAVMCMLSMLIKNGTWSVIACLCYVLLGETLLFGIGNLSRFSETTSRIVDWGIRHSVYGMALRVSEDYNVIFIIINALTIIFLSTTVGLMIFRKYEL